MARYLYVREGVVVNVVEHPTAPPEVDVDGSETVLDPTGTTDAGTAFDMTDTRKERTLDRQDVLVFRELLRLTNESRAQSLPPLSAITAVQYRAFLKGLL